MIRSLLTRPINKFQTLDLLSPVVYPVGMFELINVGVGKASWPTISGTRKNSRITLQEFSVSSGYAAVDKHGI